MDKKAEVLHKLCEALMEELEEYSKKIEKSDGMSVGDLEAVDKLSHALKSIKTTAAMIEAGEEGNSYRNGNSNWYMPWYGNNSNRSMSSSRRGSNPTGRNQYSREGRYSYAEQQFEMALQEAMNAAPDEHVREKLQHILDEM